MASQVSPDGASPLFYFQFSPLCHRVCEKISKQIRICMFCQLQQVCQVKLEMTRELQQQLERKFLKTLCREELKRIETLLKGHIRKVSLVSFTDHFKRTDWRNTIWLMIRTWCTQSSHCKKIGLLSLLSEHPNPWPHLEGKMDKSSRKAVPYLSAILCPKSNHSFSTRTWKPSNVLKYGSSRSWESETSCGVRSQPSLQWTITARPSV